MENLDKETIESDLFSVETCEDMNGEYAQFGNCKMLRDFGPVKKVSMFETIVIRFQNGRFIEFYNDELQFKVAYKLTPDIC